MNRPIPIAPPRSGVVFVIDRVMHYHSDTMKAIESGLAKYGIPFTIVSAQDKEGAAGRVTLRDKVVTRHKYFRLSEHRIGTFQLRYQHGLMDLVGAASPAVVVSTCHSGTGSEWLLLRWARRNRVRCVAWQCGYEYNPGRLKALALKYFVPFFDFHLCYHTNAQRFAVKHGARPDQTLVMHNTIDESKIVAGDKAAAKLMLAAQWPTTQGRKVVLYVGAVLEEKGLDVVFAALDRLQDRSVFFVLVGDGPYLAALRERYRTRDDWVSTGQVIAGVGMYFDAADVFVLPGTGGLAINEAMAHATAVIAGYADGSADDLISDEISGFRLRDGTPEELSSRLRDVLSSPQRAMQMGAAGEARIRGALAFQSFVARVVTVLADQHALAQAVETHDSGNEGQGRISGVAVDVGGREDVLLNIERRIAECRSGGCIAITNTESMYHALRRPDHLAYINRAQHSLCDGVGVIFAGWFWGLKVPRYNGPILQLDCSDRGQSKGWRHFLYGGKEGVADEMARRLKQRFPELKVVGTYCPPFRELTAEEDAEVVRKINEARPDFVWVGLGLLKQEAWIAAHLGRIEAPWIVGVGAAFDYHSGAVPWAPAPLRALGLEWLFRLIVQPRLRAKRYWWSLVFVAEAALSGLVGLRFMRRQGRPAGR